MMSAVSDASAAAESCGVASAGAVAAMGDNDEVAASPISSFASHLQRVKAKARRSARCCCDCAESKQRIEQKLVAWKREAEKYKKCIQVLKDQQALLLRRPEVREAATQIDWGELSLSAANRTRPADSDISEASSSSLPKVPRLNGAVVPISLTHDLPKPTVNGCESKRPKPMLNGLPAAVAVNGSADDDDVITLDDDDDENTVKEYAAPSPRRNVAVKRTYSRTAAASSTAVVAPMIAPALRQHRSSSDQQTAASSARHHPLPLPNGQVASGQAGRLERGAGLRQLPAPVLSVRSVDGDSVKLCWDASKSAGTDFGRLKQFQLYYYKKLDADRGANSSWTMAKVVEAESPIMECNVVLTARRHEEVYYFAVRGIDAFGRSGEFSRALSVTLAAR